MEYLGMKWIQDSSVAAADKWNAARRKFMIIIQYSGWWKQKEWNGMEVVN